MKTKHINLSVSDLKSHPKNMRRFYPVHQVQEMANSIEAHGGVLEPLIITWDGNGWVVVDGNMRLAGARLLEDKCPQLECKVVEKKEADQLLAMVTANQVRYEVDPVSEGLHYKMLEKEGLTIREISKRTGVYEARIINRKVLADLDLPIQKLIVDEKFPASHVAANALLRLKSADRVKLATKLAENPNTTIKTIVKACENLLNGRKPEKKLKRPGVELSGASGRRPGPVTALRQAVKNTCQNCNQYEGKVGRLVEPAWAMVVHQVDETCNKCPIKEVQDICGSCPMVELLRGLVGKGTN